MMMPWMENIESPRACQLKCQETDGCYYFGTEQNNGRCVFYNERVIKPIIEMDSSSRYYWTKLQHEYTSEVVTLTGPRECPNKKSNYRTSYIDNVVRLAKININHKTITHYMILC